MIVFKLKAFDVEKFTALKSIAFIWSLYPWIYVVTIHPNADSINTIVILWINGSSGKLILISIDAINDIRAAISTDIDVAFFQNNATKKITTIPGEKYPVKFCIYWKIDSKVKSS